MHDGPTHLPTGPRNYQALPKAKPHASLAALQWAADKSDQSYGTFSLNLTPEDETRIQAEFDSFKQGYYSQPKSRQNPKTGSK